MHLRLLVSLLTQRMSFQVYCFLLFTLFFFNALFWGKWDFDENSAFFSYLQARLFLLVLLHIEKKGFGGVPWLGSRIKHCWAGMFLMTHDESRGRKSTFLPLAVKWHLFDHGVIVWPFCQWQIQLGLRFSKVVTALEDTYGAVDEDGERTPMKPKADGASLSVRVHNANERNSMLEALNPCLWSKHTLSKWTPSHTKILLWHLAEVC